MQPPPIKTDTPEIWPMIIRGLRENAPSATNDLLILACINRDAYGRSKYGVGLQVDNGREPLADALDEALDAMAYTRQHYERVRTKPALRLYIAAVGFALQVLDQIP